jgi:hypothetical protein
MYKTRLSFDSDVEWLRYCAENGVSEMQISLASEILSRSTDEHRCTEAYKWLFISHWLGNSTAKEIVHFVRRSMTDEQVEKADAMVESWLENKNDEWLDLKTDEWSKEFSAKFLQSKR